jgi:hypothetical protein
VGLEAVASRSPSLHSAASLEEWDKVLALATTDATTGDVAAWAGAIVPPMSAAARWKDRQEHRDHIEPQMRARRSPNERVAMLEQKALNPSPESICDSDPRRNGCRLRKRAHSRRRHCQTIRDQFNAQWQRQPVGQTRPRLPLTHSMLGTDALDRATPAWLRSALPPVSSGGILGWKKTAHSGREWSNATLLFSVGFAVAAG